MDNWIWDIIKWILSFIGHLGLWFVVYDNIHATAWPRQHRKTTEKVTFLIISLPAIWVLTVLIGRHTISFDLIHEVSPAAYFYGVACIGLGCVFVCRWVWRISRSRLPASVTSRTSRMVNLQSELGKPIVHGRLARLLGYVPGNQATKLLVESSTIAVPGCPVELDGLRICQLSDLHFTGHLAPEYFLEVVRHANEFEPDLVLITGDIIDHPECLSWLERILTKLTATYGVYYVLGNHDRRISDEALLRTTLAGCQAIAAGGRWHELEINGARLLLAGNELPWYKGAESLPERSGVTDSKSPVLKILMSHSPDQVGWAKRHRFDLMFAGHTHGGQIRVPIVGPLVAPSRFGVKYCSGTFQIGPMLMHVSRGLSGEDMIRINCPPELGLFTIRSTDREITASP
jgi:predicted MPP superfamily phosphohydrolase